jgi:hypothetical protein
VLSGVGGRLQYIQGMLIGITYWPAAPSWKVVRVDGSIFEVGILKDLAQDFCCVVEFLNMFEVKVWVRSGTMR